MMTSSHPVYALTREMTAVIPGDYQVLPRCILLGSDKPITLQPGTLLLELGGADPAEQPQMFVYRRADGTIVCFDHPLTEEDASPVNNPEISAALNAYRPLEQCLREDFGLELDTTDHLSPFSLIRCPMCGSSDFATQDLACTFCSRCGASFSVHSTSGDPGFTVTCQWPDYHPFRSRYLIPQVHTLRMHMVLKNSGDPRDMDTSRCWQCEGGEPRLVGPDSGLRADLHACNVGTLYGWTLGGQVPTPGDLLSEYAYSIGQQRWPYSATQKVSPLESYEETNALDYAIYCVQDRQRRDPELHLDTTLKALRQLRALPSKQLYLHPRYNRLPALNGLQDGEYYLLERWAVVEEEKYGKYAVPVWAVARAVVSDGYVTGIEITRRDVCPSCGRQVLAHRDPADDGDSRSAHRHCRGLWQNCGWTAPAEKV